MTPQSQLDRLRELLARATPGPWEARDETDLNDAWWFGFLDPMWGFLSIGETRAGCDEAGDRKAEDAALIVALRNGADELLDEVERLRGALEEIVATLDGSSEWPDIDVRALAIADAALNPKEQTDATS